MKLYFKSLFGSHVHSCTHWLRPPNLPLLPHLGSSTRALLVSQDRRHLFLTPWLNRSVAGPGGRGGREWNDPGFYVKRWQMRAAKRAHSAFRKLCVVIVVHTVLKPGESPIPLFTCDWLFLSSVQRRQQRFSDNDSPACRRRAYWRSAESSTRSTRSCRCGKYKII